MEITTVMKRQWIVNITFFLEKKKKIKKKKYKRIPSDVGEVYNYS